MKRRIIFLVFWVTNLTVSLGQSPRDQKEAALLMTVLNKNHYKPAKIDDVFSNEILHTFIQKLDPGHMYFNQQEIQVLDQFKNSLDDEWNNNEWKFLNQATRLYREALKRGEVYLAEEIKAPTVWESEEGFQDRGNNLAWSKNEKEQRTRWRKWIRYRVLLTIRETHELDSAVAKSGLQFIRAHEQELKQRILISEKRRFKRILENPNGFENSIRAIYFRTVTTYYDPHSLYFSPQDFEIFKQALSTKEYSFGIGLSEDQNGNILVEHLIPGGPAWKSGELHKGDMLLELKWKGQSSFDLTSIGLDEFLLLLDRGNPTVIELLLQRSNGVKKKVSLKKERITTEENTVKGFVLSGTKKIGYISLPGFYTEWDSDERSSCANDVAMEIIKLKGESIEGLILDIRSNGGGSLQEAIEMAGNFIEEGPMAILADKTGKVTTLKDVNRGVVYDGPLLLLMNGQSASASELLASTIQDYHRGIIVGGESFGKATAQTIFSLDPLFRPGDKKRETMSDDFGFATITIERLYRVTGQSNQGKGVAPDIRLPEVPAQHESDLPRAFTHDSIQKKSYFKPLPALPLDGLRRSSTARVEQSSAFAAIRSVKQQSPESIAVSLNWETFLKDGRDKTGGGIKQVPPYEVTSPEFNQMRMNNDPYLKDFTASWIRNLKDDPYVSEAFSIVMDWIGMKSEK